MQEQVQENTGNQTRAKRPFALIIAIALVGVLGLGGLGTAYGLLHRNYMGYITQLKAIVADETQKFQSGDTNTGATLTDQYNYYAVLNGDIGNLSTMLDNVNSQYPLLPFKESAATSGIADLQRQMNDMAAKLATLHDCIEEDASVSSSLTQLLDSSATADVSQDMATLASRNDALDAQVSAIAFAGSIETKRAEFGAAVHKRGTALHYLKEDSAVQSELTALLSGPLASPEDVITKLSDLNARNETLSSTYAGVDLTGIYNKSIDFAASVAARKAQIKAGTDYIKELEPVIASVAEFCKQLGGTVQGAKFADKLAGYMKLVNGLQTLEDQLKAVNGKPEYAVLPVKRAIADLGLTADGQAVLTYQPAVAALGNGVKKSADMEKQIDALMKNTKMTLPDKVISLDTLNDENTSILNSLQNGVPADLSKGLVDFQAGCQERANFINYFLSYVQDKTLADGHLALNKSYLADRTHYLESADYATSHGDPDSAKSFKQRASDALTSANAEKAAYNNCLAQANKDKAAYTASRTKYQALLAGE